MHPSTQILIILAAFCGTYLVVFALHQRAEDVHRTEFLRSLKVPKDQFFPRPHATEDQSVPLTRAPVRRAPVTRSACTDTGFAVLEELYGGHYYISEVSHDCLIHMIGTVIE